MPVLIVPKDFEAAFLRCPSPKIIPTDESVLLDANVGQNNKTTFCQDDKTILSHVPSCACGFYRAMFYDGMTCPHCGTVCHTNFISDFRLYNWLVIPEEFPPVLHPVAIKLLDKWLGKVERATNTILEMLLNPQLTLPPELQLCGQGYTHFSQNFDDIINYLLSTRKSLNNRKPINAAMREWLAKYRDRIFIRHIAVLDESMHLLTSSGDLVFADKVVRHAVRMRNKLAHIIDKYKCQSATRRMIDSAMFTIHQELDEYTRQIIRVKISRKPGFIRRSILGTRMHCTGRAVIAPIPINKLTADQFHSDVVYMPWKAGLVLYKLEILNLLQYRYGFSMPKALAKLNKAMVQYDPDIDQILQTLIRECREKYGYRGLPIMCGRNPSMRPGNIYLLFVAKVKPEVADTTMNISPIICKPPNFDYDGDALHFLSIKEMDLVPKLMRIHPSAMLLCGEEAGISGDIHITNQAALALNEWLFEL